MLTEFSLCEECGDVNLWELVAGVGVAAAGHLFQKRRSTKRAGWLLYIAGLFLVLYAL